MTGDIDILAATAYETGIDPIDYAVANVIQAHVEVFLLTGQPMPTDTLSCLILGDLLGAGWTPPEVAR